MSYAMASALQAAVYAQLQGDGALASIVDGHVFDALPTGVVPPIYVSLGPEQVREAGDRNGEGAWHDFVISVVTEQAGFQTAKEAAAAISDCLHGADMGLTRGSLIGLWFRKARATRESGGRRRIDLTFRARVDDAPAV